MSEKIKTWIGVIAFIAVVAGLALQQVELMKANRELKEQVSHLQVSLAHATIPIDYSTIRDSLGVARQEIVTIDKTDYKKQAADRQLIKDLQLKVDQVEAENQMLRQTKDTVKMEPAPDTLNTPNPLLTYKDQWADFTYNMRDSQLIYSIRDSLTTYVTRLYKHRFLWWRWGTKGYEIVNVSHNPHTTVVYNKYIQVK